MKMQKYIFLGQMIGWTPMHFQKVPKSEDLTLVGEARLWYESLRPIALDWNGLQNKFRQQYTGEQLFHAWRSFHFDENTET